MSLKKLLARLIPPSVLRKILLRKDKRGLSDVDSLPCNLENLISANSISIAALMNSAELAAEWETISPTFQSFEIPDMTGGVNPGDRRAIYFLARSLNAKSVLEVGTHIGASTSHLAAALQKNGGESSANLQLTTVDIADVNDAKRQPWLDHGSKYSPAQLVEKLNCQSFVDFQTRPSLEFMKSYQSKFDLIFLDGDHSAKTTYQEIPEALKLLNPGGAILLHDFFPDLKPLWSNNVVISGPCLAVDRFVDEGRSIKGMPFGDLPWPTKLDSHRTSLALLAKID